MKKIIGYICILIAVLNVVGFIYLIASNPDKFSSNTAYFLKKIAFAIIVGGIGIWLIQSKSKSDGSDHLSAN